MVSIATARESSLKIDFVADPPPHPPNKLGVTVLKDYSLREAAKFIDWNPFFATWELRGKYPNRGYPKIFNDATVGAEAKDLFANAQKMLNEIMDGELLTLQGIVGMYPANSVGDDVELYANDDRGEVSGAQPRIVWLPCHRLIFACVCLAGGRQDVHAQTTDGEGEPGRPLPVPV